MLGAVATVAFINQSLKFGRINRRGRIAAESNPSREAATKAVEQSAVKVDAQGRVVFMATAALRARLAFFARVGVDAQGAKPGSNVRSVRYSAGRGCRGRGKPDIDSRRRGRMGGFEVGHG